MRLANPLRALLRRAGRYVAAVALLTSAALVWSLAVQPTAAPDGWGTEALTAQHEAPAWSPIALVNACGMGASSCFKCHNGKRAAAPKMDRKSGAWHADHKTVNHSCVGCHSGNARIIKQELAHSGLITDPRTRPETCAACHKSQDTNTLLKAYQQNG